jgi:hypothetical protein
MYHGCKRRVDLDGDIFALETDWVTHFVAIDVDTDNSGVHELYLNVAVASFKSDLLLRFRLGAFLNFFDDEFHLIDVKRTIWLRTLISDSARETFDELTCYPDNRSLSLDTGLLFGLGESCFAITNDTPDVGDRSAMHVADILASTTDAYDFEVLTLYPSNERFDKFRPDIETNYVLVGRLATFRERLFDFVE